MKKITILLGAGFAQFCNGLGTKDINQLFSNFDKWKISEISLYDYTKNILEDDYYDFNFETFLAIIENICSYRLSQFRDGQTTTAWKGLSSTIFDLKPEFNKCPCFKDQVSAYEVLRSYINLIIDNVMVYDDCTKCKKEIGVFENFIVYLREKEFNIKLYSTNYDLIVPKALGIRGACLGVSDDITKQEFIYDVNHFRHLPLTYFSLHGSSYIYQEAYGRFYLSNIAQAVPFYAQSNRGGNPNNETLFTPIISGYNKLEHINGRPFNFGFQTFTNDCFDSDLIITMGYSYSDPHINSIIETFSNCKIECITLDTIPVFPTPMDFRVNTNTNGIEYYLTNALNNELSSNI